MERFVYTKDHKVFITEVDEEFSNIIFKVFDPIEEEYILIRNNANSYNDYTRARNKYKFLELCTYTNIIDFYNQIICYYKLQEEDIETNGI